MGSHQRSGSGGTRFTEDLTGNPEAMSKENRQKDEAKKVVVRDEVGRIEGRAKGDGK